MREEDFSLNCHDSLPSHGRNRLDCFSDCEAKRWMQMRARGGSFLLEVEEEEEEEEEEDEPAYEKAKCRELG